MRRVDSISFYVRTEETAREFAVASRTRPLAVKRVGSKIVLCRPFGTRPICRSYPALPCRAIGCSVPAGLLSLRHLSMTLQVSMALRAADLGCGIGFFGLREIYGFSGAYLWPFRLRIYGFAGCGFQAVESAFFQACGIYGFSKVRTYGFTGCGSIAFQVAEGFAIRRDRRGLKPVIFSIVIARLKPCPDTKRSIFRAPNAASRSKVKFSRRFFNPYPSRNVTFSAASGSVPFQNRRLARFLNAAQKNKLT